MSVKVLGHPGCNISEPDLKKRRKFHLNLSALGHTRGDFNLNQVKVQISFAYADSNALI